MQGLIPRQHNIISIPVKKLKFDDGNPNMMTPVQFTSLENSVKQFGLMKPIVVDQNYVVIDGEHRLKAMINSKYSTIPAVIINVENDNERRLLRQMLNKIKGQHDMYIDIQDLLALTDQYGMEHVASLIAQDTSGLKYFLEKHGINTDQQDEDKSETEINISNINNSSFDIICPHCSQGFNYEDVNNK